jgi:hypothetical protein
MNGEDEEGFLDEDFVEDDGETCWDCAESKSGRCWNHPGEEEE